MADLLTGADFEACRAAIDAAIHDGILSDSLMQLDQYKGEAEREVLSLYPNAATAVEGSAEFQRARTAAIYLWAARLCPVTPQIESETSLGRSYKRTGVDYAIRAQQLRGEALDILDQLAESDGSTPPRRFDITAIFGVAHGRRGWIR